MYITQGVTTRKIYNSRSDHTQEWDSASLMCDILAKNLLHPLSVKCGFGKDQDPVEMLENSMLICSLLL